MNKLIWCCNESGMVFAVEADLDLPQGLLIHLVTAYPNNIYFYAGAIPVPLED